MAKPKMQPLQKAVVTWLTAHPDTSQRGLAEKAGIDPGSMSRIVSGEKPSLAMESAGKLAAAMTVTVEDLLAGRATGSAGPAAGDVRLIDLALIDPSPHNPRKTIDEAELADLAASIAEQGLLQPLVVMNAFAAPGRYELIAGHRRLRALALNETAQALCVVRAGATTSSSRALQIIENLQRVDIAPLEEAQAFADLQDESPTHWTAKAIARAIGKSDRFVSQRLSLARNLTSALKDKLAAGALKIEVARVLAAVPARLQKEAAASDWTLRNVEETRSFIYGKAVPVSKAAFPATLYAGEYLEDGDKRWFADVAQFDKLQKAAALAEVETLKTDWPAAALVGLTDLNAYAWADSGDYVNPYYLTHAATQERCAGLDAADCTALVYLKEREIKVVKNVVTRAVWREKAQPTVDDGEDDQGGAVDFRAERAEQEARRAEAVALDARLATGIAGRLDIAKRLVVYAFLGRLGHLSPEDADVSALAAPWAALFADLLPAADDGAVDFEPYDPPAVAEDRLWPLLAAQDDATIDLMLARLMSTEVTMAGWNNYTTGLYRAIAAAVGVEIPAAFHPAPAAASDAAATDAGAA